MWIHRERRWGHGEAKEAGGRKVHQAGYQHGAGAVQAPDRSVSAGGAFHLLGGPQGTGIVP